MKMGLRLQTLKISVRDNDLMSFERQVKLKRPTNLVSELVPAAMDLFKQHYRWSRPIRSLGLRGADLIPEGSVYQLNLFENEEKRNKRMCIERCVDRIRGQYGRRSIQRAVLLREKLKSVNANNDNGDAQTFYAYR